MFHPPEKVSTFQNLCQKSASVVKLMRTYNVYTLFSFIHFRRFGWFERFRWFGRFGWFNFHVFILNSFFPCLCTNNCYLNLCLQHNIANFCHPKLKTLENKCVRLSANYLCQSYFKTNLEYFKITGNATYFRTKKRCLIFFGQKLIM